jgi:hypothetical protein
MGELSLSRGQAISEVLRRTLLQRFTQSLAFGLTSRSRCFDAGSILVKAHIQSENDDRTVGKGPRADRGKNEITDLGNKHLHGFASLKWTPE